MSQINYIYSFIRTDLPFHQQLIQTAHSALEAGREHPDQNGTSHLILFEADSEQDLLNIALYLTNRGIQFHLFYEPDHNYGHTSLTTEPIYGNKQRSIFKNFTLYGKGETA